MTTDIKVAVEGILDRQDDFNLAEAYYKGNIGERFANQSWARLFSTEDDYNLNFAATVVDAVQNRLEIAAILGSTDKAKKVIQKVWDNNELVIESNEIHRWTLAYGEACAIVWPDANGEIQISYNSPKTTQMFYSQENNRVSEFAAKMWEETDGTPFGNVEKTRLNLYYPDRIEKYEHTGASISGDNNWVHITDEENPFGVIPVFHFRTARPQGEPEHKRAYSPQDMVNKIAANHMIAVDYQGVPQRYALAAGAANGTEVKDFDEEGSERDNLGALKNGAGELWYLEGVTNVGEFKPADSKNFLDSVTAYVRSMASLTNTPLHYFEKTGNIPSGEALRTAEAPLLKKVGDRQLSFGSTWKDIFKFVLKIEGIKADVDVKWKSSESIDSLSAWEVAVRMKAVGMPLEYILEAHFGMDAAAAKKIADAVAQQNPAGAIGAQPGMNAHNLALQNQKNAAQDAAAQAANNAG